MGKFTGKECMYRERKVCKGQQDEESVKEGDM